MGKAIVATPTDGTRELIADRENGLVVPFNDAPRLADAILELCSDRQLFTHCSTAATALVAQRFDARRVADSVMRIYNNFI